VPTLSDGSTLLKVTGTSFMTVANLNTDKDECVWVVRKSR
jgi:hypothetical protein